MRPYNSNKSHRSVLVTRRNTRKNKNKIMIKMDKNYNLKRTRIFDLLRFYRIKVILLAMILLQVKTVISSTIIDDFTSCTNPTQSFQLPSSNTNFYSLSSNHPEIKASALSNKKLLLDVKATGTVIIRFCNEPNGSDNCVTISLQNNRNLISVSNSQINSQGDQLTSQVALFSTFAWYSYWIDFTDNVNGKLKIEKTKGPGEEFVHYFTIPNDFLPKSDILVQSPEDYDTAEFILKCLDAVTIEETLPDCQCQNGVPDKSESCRDDSLLENCQSCNSGFDKKPDNRCVRRACLCQNGSPNIGEDCQSDGSVSCASCFTGYKLDRITGLCQPFSCTCENGTPKDFATCKLNGNNECQSCNSGYNLVGNICVVNQCRCPVGGVGESGENGNCPEDQQIKCKSCFPGYFMNSATRICQPNICSCQNGAPASEGTCPTNNAEYCDSCYTHLGFTLVRTQTTSECQINKCKCQNGRPAADGSCQDSRIFPFENCDSCFNFQGGFQYELVGHPERPTQKYCRQKDIPKGCGNSGSNSSGFSCVESDIEGFLSETQNLMNNKIKNAIENKVPIAAEDTKMISGSIEKMTRLDNLKIEDESMVSQTQEIFENVLIWTEGGSDFLSPNELITVKTTSVRDARSINSQQNYFSLQTDDIKIKMPKNNIAAEKLNDVSTCQSPVGLAQLKYAKHLQPDDSNYQLPDNTFSVITCDKEANKKFNEPVILMIRKQKNSNPKSKHVCAYYEPKYGLWLQIPNSDSVNSLDHDDDKITCTVDHFTYFSLLFKENPTNDDKILTMIDIVLSCLSLILWIFTTCFYFAKNLGKKYFIKPIQRNLFHLFSHLALIHIVFLFGQGAAYPRNDNPPGCLTVAILLHILTLSLFFKMFYVALMLLNYGIYKAYGRFKLKRRVQELLEFIGPFIISGLIVMTITLVTRYNNGANGMLYLYGGLKDDKAYLKMTISDDDATQCFIQGNAFYFGLILPYGLAMTFVLINYILLTKQIIQTSRSPDLSLERSVKYKEILVRLMVLFFTMGIGWAFLIPIVAVEDASKTVSLDYFFIIFKGVQIIVLFFTMHWNFFKRINYYKMFCQCQKPEIEPRNFIYEDDF